MMLYLLRHGVAEETEPGGDDRSRRLTARGRVKIQKATAGMRALGLELDVILTSPLPRAAETAAIVAAACGKESAPRELPALAPGPAASVVPALRPFARRSHVMLVGHEPGLGQLASLLLTGSTEGMALDLKKGGCVAIELTKLVPPTGAALRWVLTPKQLRQIG
jgi:phosphohistidine phosphatase